MKIVRITNVRALDDFFVELEFSDGLTKKMDLDVYLQGEVFEAIRSDQNLFRSVRVAEGERTISWPNGADIDPYTLYYGLIPEWNEEDDAVAEALDQRRKNAPQFPAGVVAPEIGVH